MHQVRGPVQQIKYISCFLLRKSHNLMSKTQINKIPSDKSYGRKFILKVVERHGMI